MVGQLLQQKYFTIECYNKKHQIKSRLATNAVNKINGVIAEQQIQQIEKGREILQQDIQH